MLAIDLETARVIECIRMPGAWGGSGTALAVHGPVLAAGCGSIAALWDTRMSSSAATAPVAMCGAYSFGFSRGGAGGFRCGDDDDEHGIAGLQTFRSAPAPGEAWSEDAAAASPAAAATATTIAVDDWAVWLAHRGCDGVRLYDMRRAVGPPRRPSDSWRTAVNPKP
jgi:hypothetical protein